MNSELNIQKTWHDLIVILIGAILSIITIFNIVGTIRTIGLLVIFVLFLFLNKYSQLLVLLFLTGFAADINTSFFGIPFTSFLQISFIFKVFMNKRYVSKGMVTIVGLLLILQIPSVMFAKQTIIHIATFMINILMMLAISTFDDSSDDAYAKCMITFSAGIVVILIASIVRDPAFFSGIYYRFKGIWNDQNFFAMFCALAIMSLYYWMKSARRRTAVALLLSAILLYCAYRTYSMTFIFAAALLIAAVTIDFLNSSISKQRKLLGVILLLAISAFFFMKLYNGVISGRGRLIYTPGEDWTHGRLRDTGIVFNAWKSSITNILFGIGVDNSVSYTGYAAHNSYVEILAQFGILGSFPILISIIGFIKKYNVSVPQIINERTCFVFILLMYMGTLSMQSTDVWYLFMGLFMWRFCGKIEQEEY